MGTHTLPEFTPSRDLNQAPFDSSANPSPLYCFLLRAWLTVCQAAGSRRGTLRITAKRPPRPAAVLGPHLHISQMLSCFWQGQGLSLKETVDQVAQIIMRWHVNQSEIIMESYSI